MSIYEIISLILASISIILTAISLFFVTKIYNAFNIKQGNNNQTLNMTESSNNKINQTKR